MKAKDMACFSVSQISAIVIKNLPKGKFLLFSLLFLLKIYLKVNSYCFPYYSYYYYFDFFARIALKLFYLVLHNLHISHT